MDEVMADERTCHCCLWCALIQLERIVVSLYLDEVLGTPHRTRLIETGNRRA